MTLSRQETQAMKNLGRKALEQMVSAAKASQDTGISRSFAKVTKVYGDGRLDVDSGTTALPMALSGVRMTMGCAKVKVGDTVVVDTYAHVPLVTGLIATSDTLGR